MSIFSSSVIFERIDSTRRSMSACDGGAVVCASAGTRLLTSSDRTAMNGHRVFLISFTFTLSSQTVRRSAEHGRRGQTRERKPRGRAPERKQLTRMDRIDRMKDFSFESSKSLGGFYPVQPVHPC